MLSIFAQLREVNGFVKYGCFALVAHDDSDASPFSSSWPFDGGERICVKSRYGGGMRRRAAVFRNHFTRRVKRVLDKAPR